RFRLSPDPLLPEPLASRPARRVPGPVMYGAFLFRHGLPLGIVLRGLIGGGVLTLSAAGVVLVYRIDRVVNFAQAGFGAVAAVCAVGLTTEFGWPWLITFPVGLIAGALFGALMSVGVVDRM